MSEDEAKKAVVDYMNGKSPNKTKFYLKDFNGLLVDFGGPRAVKNLINQMVKEGTLEYWSSGSTTMIGLKGAGKQHGEEAAF